MATSGGRGKIGTAKFKDQYRAEIRAGTRNPKVVSRVRIRLLEDQLKEAHPRGIHPALR